MKALVGYTGFVGSNICKKTYFDAVYNSKNIENAYGTNPDLLIYAGVRAEKYLANNMPEKDLETIIQAEKNIERINPAGLVLISTIDVFKAPYDVNEKSKIDTENLHAYGYNRYQLETWVRENYSDSLIIRLPALFGDNIKKNFIYDYINVVPSMVKQYKMAELLKKEPLLEKYYQLQDNGFYKILAVKEGEKEFLKKKFIGLGFTALDFTDSRSRFQFYPLDRLWADIQIALNYGIKILHTATEPVTAGELYYYLSGKKFLNELNGTPADYNYKTVYCNLFGGEDGYICGKQEILEKIKVFVEREGGFKNEIINI